MDVECRRRLADVAEAAITQDRTISGPYPPRALAHSAVDALFDPANRDLVLEALSARPVGRLAADGTVTFDGAAATVGASVVFAVPDPRSFS